MEKNLAPIVVGTSRKEKNLAPIVVGTSRKDQNFLQKSGLALVARKKFSQKSWLALAARTIIFLATSANHQCKKILILHLYQAKLLISTYSIDQKDRNHKNPILHLEV